MSEENITALTMPKWGLSMKEGKLVAWLVNEGDSFGRGSELAEVETEKISSAVEAAGDGVIRKIVGEVDTVYPVGALLAVAAPSAVSDAEIDAFVEKFQEEFVPEEADGDDEESRYAFADIDGARIRYSSVGEAGDWVILVHGFGGDLDNWLFNQSALAQAGHRVLALDLPGHGGSVKEVGDGSAAYMAKVVQGLMDHLEIDAAHCVGHSFGAAVITSLASAAGARVKSLNLVCPAGFSPTINGDYLDSFVTGSSRRELKPALSQLFADPALVTRQLINGILEFKRLDGVAECLQQIRGGLSQGSEQSLSLLSVLEGGPKTLVVIGQQDHIIPGLENIAFPENVERIVLDQIGHMAQMEASNQVNEALIARCAS